MAPSPPPSPRPSPYPPPQRSHAAPKQHRKGIWLAGAAVFLAGLILGALVLAGDPEPEPLAGLGTPTAPVTVTESVTVTASPVVTATATATATVTASPSPSRTPTPTPRERDRDPWGTPGDDARRPRAVDPGDFCDQAGAIGIADGRLYTCKGPGPLRWRR